MSTRITENFELLDDNERISNLCGVLESHLRLIEKRCLVEIYNRGPIYKIIGDLVNTRTARAVIEELFAMTQHEILTPESVHLCLNQMNVDDIHEIKKHYNVHDDIIIKTKCGLIKGRGKNQKNYLHNIMHHDITFGIGPAGSGKTFLAVASAIDALERETVRRIILVRPAVEAGEHLGFLPGDLVQKIDPYLRPLYDALYEMLGFERVTKLIERNVIELAPLAFMRGRTLNDAFIILDEAQNTTTEQMKMFLTRIGFGSMAVITGDVSQIDLPRHIRSGLVHAMKILETVNGISINFFKSEDIVRHPMVAKIVNAYECAERIESNEKAEKYEKQGDGVSG